MSATDAEFAPAKINLALHVRARQADGYHALETLFVFAEVGDTVCLNPPPCGRGLGGGHSAGCLDNSARQRTPTQSSPQEEGLDSGFTLVIDGPFAADLDVHDNLVLRAARALAEVAHHAGGAVLGLTKRLPIASGIGGGSADAAATLRLLNRVWRLNWSLDRLAELGASLGADVPACVHSRPMRGEGRGERLTPVAFPGAAVVLVNPGVAVSTGAVFAAWDRADRGPLGGGDALAAAYAGRNDLEPPAIAVAPAVTEALAALSRQPGARLARMSGSGATCFALVDCDRSATLAAQALKAAHPLWWVASTRLVAS